MWVFRDKSKILGTDKANEKSVTERDVMFKKKNYCSLIHKSLDAGQTNDHG